MIALVPIHIELQVDGKHTSEQHRTQEAQAERGRLKSKGSSRTFYIQVYSSTFVNRKMFCPSPPQSLVSPVSADRIEMKDIVEQGFCSIAECLLFPEWPWKLMVFFFLFFPFSSFFIHLFAFRRLARPQPWGPCKHILFAVLATNKPQQDSSL